MHLSKPIVLRLGGGLVTMAAVLALVMVLFAVGANSDSPSASAVGPTPTKIANDGNLSGVNDILVGDLATGVSLFYCIGKTDHDTGNDAIKTALQCNIDIPGSGEDPSQPGPIGWCELANVFSPNDPEQDCNLADLTAGPPPPPPYSTLAPSKGYGFFYPTANHPSCASIIPAPTSCTVTVSCFEDVGGPNTLGPNIVSRAVIVDPKAEQTIAGIDGVTQGGVDIWYNQNNARCKDAQQGIAPTSAPNFAGLDLFSIRVSDKADAQGNPVNVNLNHVPWRPSSHPGATILDFDGDGCTDEEELSKNSTAKCGDDPQNPSDSFDAATVDLTGSYGIGVRLVRNDCTDDSTQLLCEATHAPGFYFTCIAYLTHDTSNDNITVRPYCYIDNGIGPGTVINPEAYPGLTGDGAAGGIPPGPRAADHPSGFPNWVFGDVDATYDNQGNLVFGHTQLSGSFDQGTNDITISGCFRDQDGFGGIGTVWVELTVSANQLPGTVAISTAQPANCAGSPTGPAPGIADMSFTRTDAGLKGNDQDSDGDGVPNGKELQDDKACGLRDPYNGYDYYDVSVPRDGVIDLSNDILGVIQHYKPGGYVSLTPDVLGGNPNVTTFDNFDRPPSMTNAHGGTWNRGSGDGVIDLSNDILGVILQYNPGGCNL